jgi:hypothetical protein
MKILETGMRMATVMVYTVSAVGWMRALVPAFLQVVIASLKIPVRTLVCLGLCSLRSELLQRNLTDSSTPRPHYRLATTLHSLINPISTLCDRPPSAFSPLSSAIREQPSTEISSFLDPRRCVCSYHSLGSKDSKIILGAFFPPTISTVAETFNSEE